MQISPYVYPLLEHQPVDRQKHFDGTINEANKQMRRILNIVCDYYKVDPRNVRGPARHREPLLARQMFIFLVVKYSRISYVRIGSFLGGRHHTTVINAIEAVKNFLDTEPSTRRDLLLLEARLQYIF